GRGAARRVTSTRSTSSPAPRPAPERSTLQAARAWLSACRSRRRNGPRRSTCGSQDRVLQFLLTR
ncbi:hypothetical protein LEMLEM_LOCUS298, partial [Lemmus lemmus]